MSAARSVEHILTSVHEHSRAWHSARTTRRWLSAFGFDPLKTVAGIKGLRPFLRNRFEFSRQARNRDEFAIGPYYPCLTDRYESAGTASGHYFHQDLYVAQLVYENRPSHHYDVGSSIAGFVAHVASFCPVTLFDVRPVAVSARNIRSAPLDIMAADISLREMCDSLSCLHALEHFGLGRYGDRVDYDGYLKGWRNLVRLARPGGRLYLSVPMGEPQRIEFDAHRVFSLRALLDMVHGECDLERFAFVNDAGDLVAPTSLSEADMDDSYGCVYGCAILALRKR